MTRPLAALLVCTFVAPAPAAAQQAPPAQTAERSFLTSALHAIGGALVGGWVGYVGSQVALSDWEKDSDTAFNARRSAWVAGGMVVGALGSRLFGSTTAPGALGVEPLPAPAPRASRNILDRADIQGSGATTVYELVHSLRKEWLVPRGTHSFSETARGSGGGMGAAARMTSTPGQAAVVVYMDDVRLGEIERMRDIMISDIMEVRFIEPQEAAYRYGSGHSHGVILLRTTL